MKFGVIKSGNISEMARIAKNDQLLLNRYKNIDCYKAIFDAVSVDDYSLSDYKKSSDLLAY